MIVLCRSRLMVLIWLIYVLIIGHIRLLHIFLVFLVPWVWDGPRGGSQGNTLHRLRTKIWMAWFSMPEPQWLSLWRDSICSVFAYVCKNTMIHLRTGWWCIGFNHRWWWSTPFFHQFFQWLWKHQPVDKFLPCSEVGLFLFHLGGCFFSQSEKGFSLWDGIAIPCHTPKIACFDPSTKTFSKSKLKLWKSRAAPRS